MRVVVYNLFAVFLMGLAGHCRTENCARPCPSFVCPPKNLHTFDECGCLVCHDAGSQPLDDDILQNYLKYKIMTDALQSSGSRVDMGRVSSLVAQQLLKTNWTALREPPAPPVKVNFKYTTKYLDVDPATGALVPRTQDTENKAT